MLVVVTRLAYERPYSFAPATEEALVSLDLVTRVAPVETRRSEPCVRIWFGDGKTWDCIGTIHDFWRPLEREAS